MGSELTPKTKDALQKLNAYEHKQLAFYRSVMNCNETESGKDAEYWKLRAERAEAALKQREGWVAVPQEAIDWLMGLGDSFEPPANENLPRRQGGAGRYWWRSEFRKRAGLSAPKSDERK